MPNPGTRWWTLPILFCLAWPGTSRAWPMQAEASLDRSVPLRPGVAVHVTTGSGNIRVVPGAAGSVRVVGRVTCSRQFWESRKSAMARVQRVVADPPIEDRGAELRIGDLHGKYFLRDVAIDFQLEVPPGTQMRAGTGSGDITLSQLDAPMQLETGSGNIEVNGSRGPVEAHAGSGDLTLHLKNCGRVKAGTGSGNIRLTGAVGELALRTGSGDVEAEGRPAGAAWYLGTGSGNIHLRLPGDAGFELDASTGSGDIQCDFPVQTVGKRQESRLRGPVNGGGPSVRLSTGSGGISLARLGAS